MIDYKEYANQMRENSIVVNGIIQVTEELWLQIADIIDVLAEKQIPKKPRLNDSDYSYFECDSCGTAIAYTFEPEEHKYCLHCGQALDWGQEDE